jgi:hypothetical protein
MTMLNRHQVLPDDVTQGFRSWETLNIVSSFFAMEGENAYLNKEVRGKYHDWGRYQDPGAGDQGQTSEAGYSSSKKIQHSPGRDLPENSGREQARSPAKPVEPEKPDGYLEAEEIRSLVFSIVDILNMGH